MKMLKRISHWYSEGFIYRLSLVDEKLLQHEAPAVDHTKLTVHTDTNLSGLLVTAKEKINTAIMRWCPDTNMRSELGGLLAACESMKLLPQSKIDLDSQALYQPGLYSKTTCVDFHRLLVGTLLAYGHALEGFGQARRTGIDVLSCAEQLWLCTTLLWRIAYSHMLTQHLVLLVEQQWLVLPTNNEENIEQSRLYTRFTHEFTHRRPPAPTHDADDDDDESNEIIDSTSLAMAFSRWIRLQASHSQACHIVTKFASHAQAPVRFSLLAIKYPKPKPASSVVNNWQTTITELFSQDPATAAVAFTTFTKSSYAEDVVKSLEEKIKTALAADKCNPIFHKFNPNPKNLIKYSGKIHCEAALASLIIDSLLRLYDINISVLEVLSYFRVHDNYQSDTLRRMWIPLQSASQNYAVPPVRTSCPS
jgi:hypothetical protein